MRTLIAGALSALCLAAPAAHAATEQFAGTWQCKMGNQPMPGGANYDLWLYTFAMTLTAEGAFSATGTYEAASAGFSVPFTVNGGTWKEAEGGVVATGTAIKQGASEPFMVAAMPQADGSLSYSTSSSYGTLSIYCRK